MSERTFRVVLAIVIVIWVIFVLTPSLAESIPHAWATVQHWLPGDSPRVVVAIKNVYDQTGVNDVRVQIVTSESTLVAITDAKGEAVFEAVPAGAVREIRAQKIDYDAGSLSKPIIPHRQRARFTIVLTPRAGHRLYIGHESPAGTLAVSLLDIASRLALSAPGGSDAWDELTALDLRTAGNRLYGLGAGRIVVVNLDGSTAANMIVRPQAAAFALSPSGDTVYLLVRSPVGNAALLTSVATANWAQRGQITVSMTASQAVLLPSRDDKRLYLVPVGDDQISVYDTLAARRQAIFVIGEPIKDAVLSDNGKLLYVLGARRGVPLVIDTAGGSTPVPVLERSPETSFPGVTRLLYAEQYNGQWLCLLQPEQEQVSLIDLRRREVRAVRVGKEPVAMVYDAGFDLLFVANRGSNSLSVISVSNGTLVDTVDVRSRPTFLAIP